MKRLGLLALVALLLGGAGEGEAQRPARMNETGWTAMGAPSGCLSTSVPFFGSSVTLGCDDGLTYDAATDTLTSGTMVANVRTGTTSVSAAPATITITGTTDATPIVVTATAHGLVTGDHVSISGITGNTNANGYFKVTRLTADTFSLQNYSTGADIAGNGAHGGTPVAVAGIVRANRVLIGDGTGAQPGLAFASAPGIGFNYVGGAIQTAAFAFANGSGTWDVGGYNNRVFGLGGLAAGNGGPTPFGVLTAPSAATWQLGAADAASPVAQALKVQDATGTNANASAAWTLKGPAGTGTGTPGKFLFQTAQVGTTGTTAHTQADRLSINSTDVTTNIGTGTAVARVGGVLHVNTTPATTTGTAEQVLMTYTLPANTLSADGKGIRVRVIAQHAANTNGVLLRIYRGGLAGTLMNSISFSNSSAAAILTLDFVRTGAAAAVFGGLNAYSPVATTNVGVSAFDPTVANTFDVAATTGTAAGDVTVLALIVDAVN